MAEAIGIRLEREFLVKVEKLSREEALDRSTLLRLLLKYGFEDFMKKKAKQRYLAGKCTLSEAARMANSTLWEMQRFLIEEGYKSEYSIKDLEEDMKLLKKENNK